MTVHLTLDWELINRINRADRKQAPPFSDGARQRLSLEDGSGREEHSPVVTYLDSNLCPRLEIVQLTLRRRCERLSNFRLRFRKQTFTPLLQLISRKLTLIE
jgi:hypothetical protein